MESITQTNSQMDIEESETSKNQANNNQNQMQEHQKSIIQLDSKALEILHKNYEKKIPIKEFSYNEEKVFLPTRYKPGPIIGSGAYGIIFSAIDTQNNNQTVAIKKLKSISDNIDLKRIAREVLIMKIEKM